MHKWVMICVLMIGLSSEVFALQVKPIKDNQTITAHVASKELTRIFVEGDRIQQVRGIQGTYELTKDEKLGAIFIKPSVMYSKKIINLFVTTELGHTYSLLLMPIDSPSETIQLKPLSPALTVAKHWEQDSDYIEKMIQLTSYMVNKIKPEGYAVIDFPKIKFSQVPHGLTMQLMTLYRGSHVEGEIWKLKNTSCKTLHLTAKDFFNRHVRAMSLDKDLLRCHEETYLYRVVDHA